MPTRKTLLALAAMAAAASLPIAASAQIVNPDNDSAAFFRYQPQAAQSKPGPATLPRVGQVSADGSYAYSGSDRGWVSRGHAYTVQGGTLMHVQDCLPYNQPAPLATIAQPAQKGPFADHGT